MFFIHKDMLLHPALGGLGKEDSKQHAEARQRARTSQGHSEVLGDTDRRFTFAPLALTEQPMQLQAAATGTSHPAKAAQTLDQSINSSSPSLLLPCVPPATHTAAPSATCPLGPRSGWE